jgi:hypothetical protein
MPVKPVWLYLIDTVYCFDTFKIKQASGVTGFRVPSTARLVVPKRFAPALTVAPFSNR